MISGRFLVFAATLFLGATAFANPAPRAFDLKEQVEIYRHRYGLNDPYVKLIDNRGEGHENLYGVRNFRAVLHGVYYRGGANNTYNREGRRSNDNPVPDNGLDNLCREDFGDVVYLYTDNWEDARKRTSCRDFAGRDNVIDYKQISAFKAVNERPLMQLIHDHIKGRVKGPMYAHCWNGWHASGMVAAMALRQFCGWSASQAEKYWIRNTDGDSDYPSVKKRIRNFKPYADLTTTAEERALICP